MAETQTTSSDPLFTPVTANTTLSGAPSLSGNSFGGGDISQSEKDAILRQIHPIFLTTHTDEKPQVVALSNFDKFLNFLRLCLEGFLKFVDIIIDAAIQIARLAVWIVAISGVLIVVTLMTNTTDKFIDLLNESVFKAFGWETRIEKVPATTADTTDTSTTPLESSALSNASETDAAAALAARKARLEAARKAAEEANAKTSDTTN